MYQREPHRVFGSSNPEVSELKMEILLWKMIANYYSDFLKICFALKKLEASFILTNSESNIFPSNC